MDERTNEMLSIFGRSNPELEASLRNKLTQRKTVSLETTQWTSLINRLSMSIPSEAESPEEKEICEIIKFISLQVGIEIMEITSSNLRTEESP